MKIGIIGEKFPPTILDIPIKITGDTDDLLSAIKKVAGDVARVAGILEEEAEHLIKKLVNDQKTSGASIGFGCKSAMEALRYAHLKFDESQTKEYHHPEGIAVPMSETCVIRHTYPQGILDVKRRAFSDEELGCPLEGYAYPSKGNGFPPEPIGSRRARTMRMQTFGRKGVAEWLQKIPRPQKYLDCRKSQRKGRRKK